MTARVSVALDDLAAAVKAFHGLQLAVQQLINRPNLNAPPQVIRAARVLSVNAADSLLTLSNRGRLELGE